MADFYSNVTEESLIYRVSKEGLGFEEGEMPKYFILRLALALALRLKTEPLNSRVWEDKRLGGSRAGGKEYNLEQLTGKSKESDDYDMLHRAMLYWKFREYLSEDFFHNDKAYIDLLTKNIQRGLYEIYHSWKNKDCFYQWCKDKFEFLPTKSSFEELKDSGLAAKDSSLFDKIEAYCKDFAIKILHMGTTQSYRHDICKIEVKDFDKLQAFDQRSKQLSHALGFEVKTSPCAGMPRCFNIIKAREEREWKYPSVSECKNALKGLREHGKLAILAGFDIEAKPFYFDLARAVHLLVAGTTGSGKTILLNNFARCLLLHEDVDVVVIDPKGGIDYNASDIRLIKDSKEAIAFLETLLDEMKKRYESMQENKSIERYKVVIVDELNFLITENKQIGEELAKQALIARQAGIHLILATQNPDAKSLSRNLRTNMPSRIALRVAKAVDSNIILDEPGAEKLTGKGEMLIRLEGLSEVKRVFGLGQQIG
ncbi:FtsK/SpoIIIE domain-containing protein [Helicobacter mustelae]|uniref:Putative cell-division protein n=1 Tax=Helicobacter mustelae (strain ATCC 43772 / CCUG 25715 / CIP 103759 / LMG 18044 / NCTC 12198 / R85-136P) TaxID=679897 RepID=D3UIZ1_HELM1|nr:FtsK/SpoIIIE domain-containing protein [Helicobacter mustelae]CBG40466.1 putative cell-division protein [Helicobacter mustelae 12198]SQH71965.1 cell-division protein [Helicobacter mustelae]